MKRLTLKVVLTLWVVIVAVASAAAGDAPTLKLPPFKKIKLKNGMTVFLMERHKVPLVSFNVIVRAGGVNDPAEKAGVGYMTASLLRKGTAKRTADQISSELDFMAGQFNAAGRDDYSTVSAEFLKKDAAAGLDLFADLLLNPSFPEAEFAKLQKQSIDAMKATKDRANSAIRPYFEHYLYGSHPYGIGDEITMARIKRDDVAQFHRTYYTPGNTILAVAGDFNTAEMEKAVTATFGPWAGKTPAANPVPTPAAVSGKRLLLVDKPDSTQTFFEIGNVGIPRTNPDRVYVQVVNTLFGGRFTSMINSELRIKSGLTYGAHSSFDMRKLAGPFVISTYTRNATTEKAIDLALDVLKRLHEKGISEEELKSAKEYIKGQFPPTIETSGQLASTLAELEFYGLDENEINNYYARIDAMTMADAKRVINQYFPQDNLVFVLIGKAAEIEPVAKKYAPQIDRKSISQPGF